MDTGRATFEDGKLADLRARVAAMGRTEANSGIFQQGEIIELRGSSFKVEKINKTHIVLRLQRRRED